jgi:hypothetical protein
MDDLIVIILTLLAIVAGVIGQFKKKSEANENQVRSLPEDADDPWSLTGQKIDLKPQPQKIKTKDQNFPSKTDYKKKPQFFNEKSSIFENDLTMKETTEKSLKSRTKGKFPLRKAIIYSEILKRKYT